MYKLKLLIIFLLSIEETVTSGSVKVTLKLGFIPLPGQTFDLCDLLKDVGDSCPVEPGQLSIKQTLEIPRSIPGVSIVSLCSPFPLLF